MRYLYKGLAAPILNTSGATAWNTSNARKYGWKVKPGGPYSGVGDSQLARDVYCFIHDMNMLRKNLGAGSPDWNQVRYCEGSCNPDVRQGTQANNCYNRDGMIGDRTAAEISNVIGQEMIGTVIVYPSGRAWGRHWMNALDLSGSRTPPIPGVMWPVPSASGPAGFVVANGQQQDAHAACLSQGGTEASCSGRPPEQAAPSPVSAPPPPSPAPPPAPRPPAPPPAPRPQPKPKPKPKKAAKKKVEVSKGGLVAAGLAVLGVGVYAFTQT